MNLSILRALCIIAVSLFAVPTVRAATYDIGSVAEFQIVLNLAALSPENDTINVAPGTYDVTTTLIYAPAGGATSSLSIVGDGATTTILDGGGIVQVLNLQSDGDISVSGLTVRNGSAGGRGGGLFGFSSGAFTISDSTFTGNEAGNSGGGLCLESLSVTISGSTISSNQASANGGGLDIDSPDVTIGNSTISGNTAAVFGGGGAILSSGTLSIDSSAVTANHAFVGGGLVSTGVNTISITDSTISSNTIKPGGIGGGLNVDHLGPGGLTISDSSISDNTVSGTCLGPETSVGLNIDSQGPVVFTRNLVDNNTTPCEADVAGIFLNHRLSTDTIVVADNIFSRNRSGPGSPSAAILLATQSGTLNVINNTFSGNDRGEAGFSDILLSVMRDEASLNASNNIIFGGPEDDILEIRNNGDFNATPSPTTLRNNIVDPSKMFFIPGTGVTESDNFSADPLFVDSTNGDYHLLEGSPAIDAGLDTAPGIQILDFDGDDRIMGAAVDVGADEFVPAVPAVFNVGSGILDIPELQFGGANLKAGAAPKAFDVQLRRLSEKGFVFELGKYRKITATGFASGTFSPATGIVDLPVVQVQGLKATYRVRLRKRPGLFVFDLMEGKKN